MSIRLINPFNAKPLDRTETELRDADGTSFPWVNGACRIEQAETYASNFGKQWNLFKRTQIDKFNGQTISRDRFFALTGLNTVDLAGKNILEVGSGAGRFSQVVLDHTQATLYSVDYSSAVEANYANNGPNDRLNLFLASAYALPFAPGQFDVVFCFGVIQHTPDVRKTVECLAAQVKPGGWLFVDFYPYKGFWTKLHAKYILRPWTRTWPQDKLLAKIERNSGWLIRWARFFNRIGIGRVVNRFLPLVDLHTIQHPYTDYPGYREQVMLDTFDMFSPAYDQPQPVQRVGQWVRAMGFQGVFAGYVQVATGMNALVKGRKPLAG
jgi:SAM-dependent methyltransferase